MTQVLHRHVEELTALLLKKDAEIQDYKENGAVLSRGAYSIYNITSTFAHVVNLMIHCLQVGFRLSHLRRRHTERPSIR